jgi:glycosyltransferase involved in cell wall biosynthesis
MKLFFVTHWANNMLIFRTWMLEEAVRRGHEVVVMCPADKEATRFADLGVRHIPWVLERGSGIGNLIAAIMDARRILRQERPDATVVYCVQPILAVLWAWRLGGRLGLLYPTFTGLGSLWTELDAPRLRKRMIRRILEGMFGLLLTQATRVFVLNRDDKLQVASWNPMALQGKVVQTLGEGVDLEYFRLPTDEHRAEARSRWDIPVDAKVIGFAGRLIREKGASDFLKLCMQMKRDENVHFLVVGDPDPGNPTSLTDVELCELDSVPRMHREHWMADVRPAYAAMDVLVFLSAREGLPVSPLEAMAMGVPVVGYDAVGTREVVPARWLVSTGDLAGCLGQIQGHLARLDVVRSEAMIVSKGFERQVVQGEFLREIE